MKKTMARILAFLLMIGTFHFQTAFSEAAIQGEDGSGTASSTVISVGNTADDNDAEASQNAENNTDGMTLRQTLSNDPAATGGDTSPEAWIGFLPLTSGGITNIGVEHEDDKKGRIWLTPEQEQLTLTLDTSEYTYNICYMNSGAVVKYTGWETVSPIVFDAIRHDRIGLSIKRIDGAHMHDHLSTCLVYSTTAVTVGDPVALAHAIAGQRSSSDAEKTPTPGKEDAGSADPASAAVETDTSLSGSGAPAEPAAAGDAPQTPAEAGTVSPAGDHLTAALGQVYSSGSIGSSANTAYITVDSQTADVVFDDSAYTISFVYFDGSAVTGYTSWITSSPYTISGDGTSIAINYRRVDSAALSDSELSSVLRLRTAADTIALDPHENGLIEAKTSGSKCIYPDAFNGTIKPDIYCNGKFYADIDTDDYKIDGGKTCCISPSGSDSNDGTASSPYLTLTKALQMEATTVIALEGTYIQGTHFGSWASLTGKNLIGVGTVVFQNDGAEHYVKTEGDCYIENIHFLSPADDTGINSVFYASGTGGTACFVDCIFSGGKANGLAVQGMNAILSGCTAYGNMMDGFNYHRKTVNSVTYVPSVIEMDCVAYNNGSADSGSDSCNGSTSHDGTQIIRLNGEYSSCFGGVIADIAESGGAVTCSVNFGCIAHTSTGTGTYNASFWASTNTKMYLYNCKSYGSTFDISANNDSLIVSRRLTTGRDVPSVYAASEATVYQY